MAAFAEPDFPFELAGILARGSERSRACAEHYGVPLYAHPEELPPEIEYACVVVGAGINGGPGAELAQALMRRGIHVLQEHPLHHDELAACLREAGRSGVGYQLNTHYVHIEPVRRFIAAAHAVFERQPPLFIDVICSIQVAYTLLDILGQVLGRTRPSAFSAAPEPSERLRQLGTVSRPFRSVEGVLAGIPVTVRLQNQLNPRDPDNHSHLIHRITVGAEGGTLTLATTHGPILWAPRPHLPENARHVVALDKADGEHLDMPSVTPIGPPDAPSYREILGEVWPAGVRNALLELRASVESGEDSLKKGQYHLALCRLWQELTTEVGYPQGLDEAVPMPLSVGELGLSQLEA